ncbi:MAG: response regulator [Paracoccaceae bacterium]
MKNQDNVLPFRPMIDKLINRAPQQPKPRLSALIVENNDIDGSALQQILDALGFECVRRAQSTETISMLRACKFDLVCVEIDPLGGLGLQVIRTARASDQNRAQPMIVTSRLSDYEARKQAIAMGADDYLLKPVNAGFLRSSLLNAIARRHASASSGRSGPRDW